jgi:hypothetical protein
MNFSLLQIGSPSRFIIFTKKREDENANLIIFKFFTKQRCSVNKSRFMFGVCTFFIQNIISLKNNREQARVQFEAFCLLNC